MFVKRFVSLCCLKVGSSSAFFRKKTTYITVRLAAAVAVVVADALALADLYAGLGVVGGCGAHALFDLAGHGEESLLDVAGVLGRGLEEGDSEGVGEFLI